ncbi:MAG TPA: MFS transporter, partial [Terriglobales bacterium]|nr:MFS transporter [Terriglobales bacterium]
SLLLMLVVGFGMMQGMAASNTVIQTLVPEDRRGRVMSYYTMAFVGMAPFGSLLAGELAHKLGAPHAVMITGACCFAGAIWFSTKLTSIRRVMRPIYVEMGIIRSPLEPPLEDQAGKPG